MDIDFTDISDDPQHVTSGGWTALIWLYVYGAGVLIWLMMGVLALLLPNPRVDTDVALLPVVAAEWLPFFILASVILIVIGSMLRQRVASVVLSMVLGGLGLIIVLTLIGPAIGAWYGYELVDREANIYRFDTVNERITYECDRWLLSCDVVERCDIFLSGTFGDGRNYCSDE